MNSIEKTLENIEEIKHDLLSNAYGFSNPKSENRSWWYRNYIKLLIYGFIAASTVLCYWLGLYWPARILGLLLFISLVHFVWNLIKKAWALFKIWRNMRTLLKQASHLKRE